MVVSEIKERLSPNIAPPTTAAIVIAPEMPSSPLRPALIGATAAIVPIDVPIDIEIKQAMINSPGSKTAAE